jgi:hypothetical protein
LWNYKKSEFFGYSMPSILHTVFIWLTKKYRDSTMAPVTDAETVQDDEGNAPIVRDNGKLLENGQRMAILQALLSHTKNSKLQHGAVGLGAKQFKVSRLTVSNIWKRGRESMEEDGGAMVVLHQKKKCGRKPKHYRQQLTNLSNIPLNDRTCYQSTSTATAIPTTRLHSIVKKGGIRRHSSAVKPFT